MEHKLDLSGNLFVIKSDPSAIIPAVELDKNTGFYNVLVFTSSKAADNYCYLRKPDCRENIVQLEKKKYKDDWVQVGLIRIARTAKKGYKNIKYFVFDHPGTKGNANYADLDAILNLMKFTKNKKEDTEKNELKDFLENQR